MKKILFALFAHPDDESFGPSGSLLLETRAGAELHLILLTSGDGGVNPDDHDDLGAVRLKEWRTAGALLGAHGMHYLGYKDGQLNNHSMVEISQRVIELITPIIKDAPSDTEIEFMTNDLNGVTGHIDHIVAARAACHVFYSLKKHDERLSRLRFSCLSREDAPDVNTDWLYMEAGRSAEEIDEIIDARAIRDEIIAIIRTHHTQRIDGEYLIAHLSERLGLNHFIVRK